ncbi:MAG: HD domain-containing protein [Deltaproteobacteria bacterium]|nr:HD domain-containing protein [Deltaproteobacteria bacterium]
MASHDRPPQPGALPVGGEERRSPVNGQLRRIKDTLRKRYPKETTPRHALLEQAFHDVEHYHHGQMRKSGLPAIIHPYRVALLASDAGLDVEGVIIALLHDIIEDTDLTKKEISQFYGTWLADAVDGLTKASRQGKSADLVSLETYRKLLTSSVKDIRTLLVKIFDRLDNMRDLAPLDRGRQRRISMETLVVYVPMAQRLGLMEIAGELTTLAFRFLYPHRFKRTLALLRGLVKTERRKVNAMGKILETALAALPWAEDQGFSLVAVQHQVADFIYQPEAAAGSFGGFRVIVPSQADCYPALGAIHTKCRAVPMAIRDYISNPKPTRYQGLETQVFIGQKPVKVEITWQAMAHFDKWGILADWKGNNADLTRYYQNYLDLMDRLEGDQDLKMEDVLRHAQMETLQAFTPKGDMLTFPAGATVIDFAFAIHSDLGLKCLGAQIADHPVTREHALKDGDLVEIVTAQDVAPDETWLDHVHTTRARMALHRALRLQDQAKARQLGMELFPVEVRRLGENPERLLALPAFQLALKARGLGLDQFYQEVGTRRLALRPFLAESGLVEPKKLKRQENWERSLLSRYLGGMFGASSPNLKVGRKDQLVVMARCCSPMEGDAIVGVHKGSEVMIHRENCPNLAQHDPENFLHVGWESTPVKAAYTLTVEARDRPGVIYKISKVMASLKVSIRNLTIEPRDPGFAAAVIDIEPVDTRVYQKIIHRLRSISEVLKVS